MPGRRNIIPLPIKGGWAPALGPQAGEVTHCIKAENVYWELDGGWRKIPGAARLNSSQLTESGSPIPFMALFDYWKSGAGWSPTQKRMAYAGTQLWKEDLDGTWDSIKTGLESGKQASFTQMNDIAIWSSTSTTDVPQSWDQAAASTSNLAGSPPNFSFCVPHRGRMWAAGVASNPSRLYYSALDNAEDWTGAGSGSIDIDINDGDEIMGIASHKQRLWIFKGPNRGSIHYITGSAPTGGDAFARAPFSRNVPCAAHQSIVAYQNDLAWVSTRGVHSLQATDAYGDMADGFLSFPIKDLFISDLAPAGIAFTQGVNHSRLGVLLWTVRQSGQANNDWVLAYDYRMQPGRFSLLNAYSAASLAVMIHNSQPRLFSGGYDGYCLRHDEVNRNIAGSAYTAKVRLPFLHYGNPDMLKQTAWLRVGMVPRGSDTITVTWTNDQDSSQSTTISQATGDTLDGQFILDSSILAGGQYQQGRIAIPGSYAVQQLEFSQATVNGDMEIHELAAKLETAGESEA